MLKLTAHGEEKLFHLVFMLRIDGETPSKDQRNSVKKIDSGSDTVRKTHLRNLEAMH